MSNATIGHCECPTCGFADAQVKQDKGGFAYLFCPDCYQQMFTRNAHKDALLRKRMRPVTDTDTASNSPVPVGQPAPELEQPALPEPVQKPTEPPAPPPKAAKASFFTPLMGKGVRDGRP